MYFINENDQRKGPFTIDELKARRITKSILVWCEGMGNWSEAGKIDELKSIVISEPPPLPNELKNNANQILSIKEIRLHKYSKEKPLYDTFLIGGFLIIYSIVILILYNYFETKSNEPDWTEKILKIHVAVTLITLLIRIIATVHIGKIAISLNRDPITWRIFTFIFPAITLIAISYCKQKLFSRAIPYFNSKNQFQKFILEEVNIQKERGQTKNCIDILNEATNIDNEFYEAYFERAKAYMRLHEFYKAKSDFKFLRDKQLYLLESETYWKKLINTKSN